VRERDGREREEGKGEEESTGGEGRKVGREKLAPVQPPQFQNPKTATACTSLKSTDLGLPSADSVGLPSVTFYTANPRRSLLWCVTVVRGHSRSSKFIPIESPYATSDKSAIVAVCYIFRCFRVITIYWSKVCVFSPFLPTQSRLKPPQGYSPVT